jgi:membrane protease YdiL (CAAX protease family)
MIKRLSWPPGGLGIGPPLNLAFVIKESRGRFLRSVWQYTGLGFATVAAMVGLDQLLFGGVSAEHVRALAALPILDRCIIILYSAVTEEIIFRLGIATIVAWLGLKAFSSLGGRAKPISIWFSILVASVIFGLAHVGNLPNVPHPFLRAITLNGVAGIVLGWLYWNRGLEAAIVAHLSADALIYLGIASFL